MKKKMKIVLVIVALCAIVGSPLAVHAKDHSHKYSFWKNELYYSSTLDHHRYYEAGTYKNCDIVGYYYREVQRCGCGDEIYSNYWISTKHMQCGQ